MGTLLKILTLILIFSNCSIILPSCKKGFELYQREIYIDPVYNLRTDGIFVHNENIEVLYSNGLNKGRMHYYQEKNGNITDSILNYFKKEYWGEFQIIKDTIIIQSFNRHNQELCKRWLTEYRGLVLSDTSYMLNYYYDCWKNDFEYFDPIIYIYKQNLNKPDSRDAWYYNKKWYKAKLHQSRKMNQ